jgi:hypothetical protein
VIRFFYFFIKKIEFFKFCFKTLIKFDIEILDVAMILNSCIFLCYPSYSMRGNKS